MNEAVDMSRVELEIRGYRPHGIPFTYMSRLLYAN